MDLIERVESYKALFKECKALEPVSMALAKGYKSATPLQRLEIIRELDTELAEVYSVEIPGPIHADCVLEDELRGNAVRDAFFQQAMTCYSFHTEQPIELTPTFPLTSDM